MQLEYEGEGEMPNIVDPKPDPWAPPRATAAQTVGTGAGLAGVALIAGDPDPGTFDQAIAWLPDPNQIFASVAHVLGFEFHRADAFTWGFILVVVCVALNLYSLWLRYRYAEYVKPRWDEQIAKLESEAALAREGAASPARVQGSGGS
jgi:hypothetical protein